MLVERAFSVGVMSVERAFRPASTRDFLFEATLVGDTWLKAYRPLKPTLFAQ
jgi:hypothetical protein